MARFLAWVTGCLLILAGGPGFADIWECVADEKGNKRFISDLAELPNLETCKKLDIGLNPAQPAQPSKSVPRTKSAFEVKGYKLGMDASGLDLKGCSQVKDADSGVPGFRCQTTLGGEYAELRLLVFNDKLVGFIFEVKNAHMQPVIDALSEKYGRPWQPNRYIEDYSWSRTGQLLSIRERRLSRGYSLLGYDRSLFEGAQKANTQKAKGDI